MELSRLIELAGLPPQDKDFMLETDSKWLSKNTKAPFTPEENALYAYSKPAYVQAGLDHYATGAGKHLNGPSAAARTAMKKLAGLSDDEYSSKRDAMMSDKKSKLTAAELKHEVGAPGRNDGLAMKHLKGASKK